MKSIIFLLSLWRGVYYAEAAAVFAHFMLYNSENFTLFDWEINIAHAKKAHIDAFALNIAYNFPTNNRSLTNAFAAANALDFHLLFSFDYVGNGPWPEGEVIGLLRQYGNNTAYYQHKGKPFVSTFEGSENATDWVTIKKYTDCFFVPGWSALGAKDALAVAPGVPDGLFSWAAWPEGPDPINTYIDSTYMQWLKDTGDLPYMMPVSPWFYTNLPGYGKNWIWNGDNLWYDRWQQVLSLKPEFVEIISWNDYGESHYIGPLHEGSYATFESGNASYNYAAGHPHDAWRDFLPYVIEQYKSGEGKIAKEGVTVWFRQAPGKACVNGGTMGNTETHGQKEFPPTEVLKDDVFYSALLKSDSGVEVVVDIGGTLQDGSWKNKPDGPMGIYHGSVPFDNSTGQVIVTVSRRGKIIAEMRGASVSESCVDDIQNWNAWVGSNFGNNTVKHSTRPTPRPLPPAAAPAPVSAASALLVLGRMPFMVVFVAFVATMVAATATPVGYERMAVTMPAVFEYSPAVHAAGVDGGNLESLSRYGNNYACPQTDAPVMSFVPNDATAAVYDSSWKLG
ncbi:Glycoside hydrolase family 71 [Penicillium bovifimosum]|uniref:Glycoside hydrolase family 71 n=1 Tax=Penicillium bovifimosum TaxID=126998 RepID=A0A9W9H0Z6_9EURO|nr:Glycoside hydrolase family 71 [Penicillium bovifimosum]KAJ5135535.1 Glycoside hydrolase family 71 [Penicillium bovifimosum]